MSDITREAIELPLGKSDEQARERYDALTNLVGHDLAELCRLGKAVLDDARAMAVWSEPAPDRLSGPGDRRQALKYLDSLLVDAGVERPSS